MISSIHFKLNDNPVSLRVNEDRMLLWVLRTDLGITGPKYGCGEGLCGACTVLVNNEATLSCQTAVKDVEGTEIMTIEGLFKNNILHPLQKAFVEKLARQLKPLFF